MRNLTNYFIGSGKTYTMMGDSAIVNNTNERVPGLYVLAVKDLFEGLVHY